MSDTISIDDLRGLSSFIPAGRYVCRLAAASGTVYSYRVCATVDTSQSAFSNTALVVTPVCPHLLTLRPIVVRGDSRVTVRVVAIPNRALLTVDGQKAVEMELGDEVRCARSRYTVNLVRLSESGFFEALRNKLSWGER